MSLWGDIKGGFDSVIHGVTGIGSDIKKFVVDAIHKAIDGVDKVIKDVKGEIHVLQNTVSKYYDDWNNFVLHVFSRVKYDVTHLNKVVPQWIEDAKRLVLKSLDIVKMGLEDTIGYVRRDLLDKIGGLASRVVKDIDKLAVRLGKDIEHWAKDLGRDIEKIGKYAEHWILSIVNDVYKLEKKFIKLIEDLPKFAWKVVDDYFVKNFIGWLLKTIFNVKLWEKLGEWIVKIFEWIIFDS